MQASREGGVGVGNVGGGASCREEDVLCDLK